MTYRIRETATGRLLATPFRSRLDAQEMMVDFFPMTHGDFEVVEAPVLDEPYFAPANWCPICGGSFHEPDPHTPGTCTCTPDELRRLDL